MVIAFMAMGLWAVMANSSHPWPQRVTAGAVQGSISMLITLGLKRMIETLVIALSGIRALIFPPLISILTSLTLLLTGHSLAETPEILRTIIVPLSVTTIYASTYSFSLWRHRHERS